MAIVAVTKKILANHELFLLIALDTSEGTDKLVHLHSIAKAFPGHIHKVLEEDKQSGQNYISGLTG